MPRPIRYVIMGTMIEAFGADRNVDAAKGDCGLGVKKKKKKEGGGERGREKQVCQQKGLSN